MSGITFDTGALIGLERRKQRIAQVYRAAVEDGRIVTVPSAVVTEWWRGRSDARDTILEGVRVEPLDRQLAKLAGEALGAIPKATAVDAIVMASAACRGDVVYTADVEDLSRLKGFFPTVRVLAV
jgi:predicted nucleic acid-binding protein